MRLRSLLSSGARRTVEFFERDKTVVAILVLLYLAITLILRLTPAKWGVYLNEFDPYYEYYLAEKILEHSRNNILEGIGWWFNWWFEPSPKPLDKLFWAPHGRDLRKTSQPGSAIFSATLYYMMSSLGFKVDLYTIHAFVPAIAASLAVPAVYLLGKKLRDECLGLLSAFILSISTPYIYRTNLGAKHEGIAIPAMLLGFYLFLRSVSERSTAYSILAGVSFGVAVLAWGGYLYAWQLLSLIAILWLVLHPADKAFAKSFLITNVIFQVFIAITPRFGPLTAFLSLYALLPLVANLASALALVGIEIPKLGKREMLVSAIVATSAIVAALWYFGIARGIAGRIVAVALPWFREVAITTVAEHAIPTWSQLYQDFGMLLVLSAFGAYCALRQRDLGGLFLGLLWFTSVYAASSLARLSLILSIPIALAASLGFLVALEGILELSVVKRRIKRRERGVSREVVAIAILALVLVLVPYAASDLPLRYAHQPALILTSSTAQMSADWISALEWMKTNIPRGSVVACWWDYGYWIAVNTGLNTTCDNGTINSTQIRLIARAFLSNETAALDIFRRLNVSYVVVFEPFLSVTNPYAGTVPGIGAEAYFSLATAGYGGDLGKSYQMARWIGYDPDKYHTITVLRVQNIRLPIIVPRDTPEARNATLYRLLFAKTDRRRYFVFEPIGFLGSPMKFPGYGPEEGEAPLVKMPEPEHFELVYASEPNQWVLVYKVVYPEG